MRRIVSIVILFAAAGTGLASTQGPPDPYAAAWSRVGAFVAARMRESNTPGLALAITSREGLLHAATFGYADFHVRRALAPDTLFEIGSISKSFTSIAFLQLR